MSAFFTSALLAIVFGFLGLGIRATILEWRNQRHNVKRYGVE